MNHASAHQPRLLLWAAFLLGVGAFLYFLPPFHILPLEEARSHSAEAAFNPDAFVEKFWNEQLTRSADSAVDAGKLFAALAQDPAAAAERYGHRLGLGGTSSYLMSGSGRIAAVEEGEVEIALPDGGAVVIDTGPVFGNTIRDGSGLLNVNDFANSQDFNAISAQINRRVEQRVLPKLREQAAVGKTVRFLGAVEIADSVSKVESVKLVPVAIEIL